MPLPVTPSKIFDYKRTTIKKTYTGTSASGYTMTYPKSTIAKKIFTVTYDGLTRDERDNVETWFNANAGSSLPFVDPDDLTGSTVYDVVFDTDEIEFEFSPPYYWSITLSLREV